MRLLQTAATELFLTRGYEGVSLDALIGRVGGSRRNIYGPCGGKQGLFFAAVAELTNEVASQVEALPMAGAGLREGLGRYGRHLLQLLLQPRMLAMHRLMVNEAQRFPELSHSMCQGGRDRGIRSLALWLQPFQESGELRTDLPAPRLAEQFIDLIVCGPQLRALVGELPPGWTPAGIRRHVDASTELFLHGAATAVPSATSHASPRKKAP